MTFLVLLPEPKTTLRKPQKPPEIRAFFTPSDMAIFWPEAPVSAKFAALSLGAGKGFSNLEKIGVFRRAQRAGNGVLSAGGWT
jgi:hypothetical protein